jgi:hypothetical protein
LHQLAQWLHLELLRHFVMVLFVQWRQVPVAFQHLEIQLVLLDLSLWLRFQFDAVHDEHF